jgi:hypothetical protein
VNQAAMGAFRDEGSIAIPYDATPREVARASFIASLAEVWYLPQPFIAGAVVWYHLAVAGIEGEFPAFLVGLIVSYASVLQLDAARLALLARTPDAERRARWVTRLVVTPHLLLAALAAFASLTVAQPPLASIALALCAAQSAGLAAAGVIVRRAAGGVREALERPAVETRA